MSNESNLVGLAEVAELLGRKLPTVKTWRQRSKLPAPIAELQCGPVWSTDQFVGFVHPDQAQESSAA